MKSSPDWSQEHLWWTQILIGTEQTNCLCNCREVNWLDSYWLVGTVNLVWAFQEEYICELARPEEWPLECCLSSTSGKCMCLWVWCFYTLYICIYSAMTDTSLLTHHNVKTNCTIIYMFFMCVCFVTVVYVETTCHDNYLRGYYVFVYVYIPSFLPLLWSVYLPCDLEFIILLYLTVTVSTYLYLSIIIWPFDVESDGMIFI